MDFPIEHGGSFHSYVNVYQRVNIIDGELFATEVSTNIYELWDAISMI
jgi:hypothetical protein